MPIVSTVIVSKEIQSLLFNDNDTLVVTLSKTAGNSVTQESYTLPSDVVKSLLDVQPQVGLTVRQSILLAVYNYLITSGLVEGNVQQ